MSLMGNSLHLKYLTILHAIPNHFNLIRSVFVVNYLIRLHIKTTHAKVGKYIAMLSLAI